MPVSTEAMPGRTIIARLKPGEEIFGGIAKVMEKHDVKCGYIPVLLGGFKHARIRSMSRSENPDKPQTIDIELDEPLEYHGCGTIARGRDGKPAIHIHVSAAKSHAAPVAGHLVSATVVLLTEIVIVEITSPALVRKLDPDCFEYEVLDFE